MHFGIKPVLYSSAFSHMGNGMYHINFIYLIHNMMFFNNLINRDSVQIITFGELLPWGLYRLMTNSTLRIKLMDGRKPFMWFYQRYFCHQSHLFHSKIFLAWNLSILSETDERLSWNNIYEFRQVRKWISNSK